MYFQVCILIARAIKRMHAAGLAHSDLSYRNVLIDPAGGHANIIDIDGLVVPGKFPPDVLGSPDFVAPEVLESAGLPWWDKTRKVPCRETDLHALGILIYMLLLCRHPLRGRIMHDRTNSLLDESLAMGKEALFIENDSNKSNAYDIQWVQENYPAEQLPFLFPWMDLSQLPYTVLGSHLSGLVKRALKEGLHDPSRRPCADEWETGLVRTLDWLLPCQNAACNAKWFVYAPGKEPICPFCQTKFTGAFPIIRYFCKRGGREFYPENEMAVIFNGFRLYSWLVNRFISIPASSFKCNTSAVS